MKRPLAMNTKFGWEIDINVTYKIIEDASLKAMFQTSVREMYFCRGGFPHALRPYMVYCTSPLDIQIATMPTHRASPLVPPTREQRN
jgi:hypothetical protein